MKKVGFLVLSFVLLLCPSIARAYGIDRFYMNTTVLENGDLQVEEFFDMSGSYNGFERIIDYKNVSAPSFDETATSFGGSQIHNGSGLVIEEVGAVTLDKVTYNTKNIPAMFESIRKAKEKFTEIASYSGKKGDYGVYEISDAFAGNRVKIYNPKSSKGFYLKYTLQNMGIVHNDVAEIGYNIFSKQLTESVGDFRLHITLPQNQNELRAWAHGPLNGNIALDGKNNIDVEIQGLGAYTAMDVRFVFDKEVIPLSTKKSGVNGLQPILSYEKIQADDANAQREEAKQIVAEKRKKEIILIVISSLWMVGLGIITYRVYVKNDKEYVPTFKGKYFRDFPSDLNPEIVGYLMNHRIGVNDLSASILHLIYKKKIGYEKIDKKNYKLIDKGNRDNLSLSEQKIFPLLFPKGETETTLLDFQKRAKKSYGAFLDDYSSWEDSAKAEGEDKNFFESKKVTGAILYGIIGFMVHFMLLSFTLWMIVGFIAGIVAVGYYLSFTKRTVEGNEEYSRWKGLKNFINDFGQFKERELPQIELWEKYLVYAVDFGIAEKLAKQMEIKIKEYNLNTSSVPYMYEPSYFTNMLIFNQIMNHTVTAAHSSALSASQIAHSSSSSSGGFGGGFSGGGGSFGGGGGGGRF